MRVKKMQIAIDGPAGSGKSTVAKLLAEDLNIIYLDTGAMYRAVTAYVLENNLDLNTDINQLKDNIENLEIKFKNNRVYLNDKDVTEIIRSKEVTNLVSVVSALDFVRESLTQKQQEIAQKNSVVMDGRDIGTTVLPHADFKFYIDASPDCRAKRRAKEIGVDFNSKEFNNLKEDIIRRDYLDSTREISPLTRPEDAVYVKTDDLTIQEVLDTLKNIIK